MKKLICMVMVLFVVLGIMSGCGSDIDIIEDSGKSIYQEAQSWVIEEFGADGYDNMIITNNDNGTVKITVYKDGEVIAINGNFR